MRKWWIRSLALSLGLVVTGARGQEGVSQPVPIASSKPASDTTVSSAPAATLGKPRAIARTPLHDSGLQPASFIPSRDPLAPVIRGSSPESTSARPMPNGPGEVGGLPTAGYSTWRRQDDVLATTVARNGGETSAAPPVSSKGTVLVAPTPANSGPPIIGNGGSMPAPTHGSILSAPSNATFPPPINLSGPPLVSNGNGGPITAIPGTNCPPCASNGTSCPPCTPIAKCGPCVPMAMGPCTSGATCTGGRALRGGWGCGSCCDGPDLILGVDALYWWMKGDPTPPLVNTRNPGESFRGTAITNTIFGGSDLGEEGTAGVRVRGVWWFTDRHCWGLDGSAFYLGELQDRFFLTSDGAPQVGRPFNDATPGATLPVNAQLVSGTNANGTLTGSVEVLRRSTLWGYDANLRRNLWCGDCLTCDLFFGFRSLGLDESLAIRENLVVRNSNVVNIPAGTTFIVQDKFATSNRFYGGQIGCDSTFRLGEYWTLGVRSSVGIGCTQYTLDISGSTTTTTPRQAGGIPTTQFSEGGLLALQGTNIGSYSRKRFSVVSDVGFTLGYDICDWMRLTAGYNFLYWTNVGRPGQAIDNTVNRNFVPNVVNVGDAGPRRPAPLFNTQDFFAHGVSFGLQLRW